MHALIVASAQNTLHALNRIVSVLRGRDFHVESLSVARSERPDVARVTLLLDATRTRPDRVASCLDKLEEVWSVRRVDASEVVRREAALIKFIDGSVPAEIVSAVTGSGAARVIERSDGAAILEIVGSPEDVDDAIGLLPAGSILEIARLGQLVMGRGCQQTTVAAPPR